MSVPPSPAPPPRCAECAYFAGLTSTTGECRKYAPLVREAGGQPPSAAWVVVLFDDWCGEFVRVNRPNPPSTHATLC